MKHKFALICILLVIMALPVAGAHAWAYDSTLASAVTSFTDVRGALRWSKLGLGPFSMDAGYMADSGGVSFDLDLKGNGGLDIEHISFDTGIGGVYLGASCPVLLGDLGEVAVSGSLILPVQGSASQRYSELGSPQDAGGKWDSLSSRAHGQLLWAIPVRDTVNVLLGFRYEAWGVSFTDPVGNASATDAGEARLETDLYVPLLGLSMDLGLIRIGGTVLPNLPGAISFRETVGPDERLELDTTFSRGHWAEVWMRQSPVTLELGPMDLGIGLFGIFNSTFGGSEPSLELKSGDQSNLRDLGLFDMSLYRRLYTVGVTTSLSF